MRPRLTIGINHRDVSTARKKKKDSIGPPVSSNRVRRSDEYTIDRSIGYLDRLLGSWTRHHCVFDYRRDPLSRFRLRARSSILDPALSDESCRVILCRLILHHRSCNISSVNVQRASDKARITASDLIDYLDRILAANRLFFRRLRDRASALWLRSCAILDLARRSCRLEPLLLDLALAFRFA